MGEEFGKEGFGFGDLAGEVADGGAVFGVAFAFKLAELGAVVFEGGLEEVPGLGVGEGGVGLGNGRWRGAVVLPAGRSRPDGGCSEMIFCRQSKRAYLPRKSGLSWGQFMERPNGSRLGQHRVSAEENDEVGEEAHDPC
jgi:hypothetical protein